MHALIGGQVASLLPRIRAGNRYGSLTFIEQGDQEKNRRMNHKDRPATHSQYFPGSMVALIMRQQLNRKRGTPSVNLQLFAGDINGEISNLDA